MTLVSNMPFRVGTKDPVEPALDAWSDAPKFCEGWVSLLLSHETGIYGVLGLLAELNEHDRISVRRVDTDRNRGVTAITVFVRIPMDLQSYLSELTGVRSMVWPSDIGSDSESSAERHPMVVLNMH